MGDAGERAIGAAVRGSTASAVSSASIAAGYCPLAVSASPRA
jgi:hypothetical protein